MEMNNYCLIGNPVKHSLSPIIHNFFIFNSKINAGYVAFEVDERDFENFVGFLRLNFDGFNITLPYKQKIFKYLDEVDDVAYEIGAVNCVKVSDGKLKGFNTDYYGIVKTFELFNVDLNDKEIVVVGCGGAARPLFYYLKGKPYKNLMIINRTVEKAEKVASEFELEKVKIISLSHLEKINNCDIIINASSIGLDNGVFMNLKLSVSDFAFDMQYKLNGLTPFLKEVEVDKKSDGIYMLILQAIKSYEIWNNKSYNFDINKIIKHIEG